MNTSLFKSLKCALPFIGAAFLAVPGWAADSLTHVVVRPISNEPILHDTFPLNGISSGKILITGCRGQLEPFSFVLREKERERRLILRVSDLKGDGTVIPGKTVDLTVVKIWHQAATAWKDIRFKPGSVLVPELLLKNEALVRTDPVTGKNLLLSGGKYLPPEKAVAAGFRDDVQLAPVHLEKKINKQIWGVLKIPDGQNPGVYTGKIELIEKGKPIHSIGIEVTVLPFDLMPPNIEYSIYYRGLVVVEGAGIGSELKSKEQYRKEMDNLRDHGITNPTLYQSLQDRSLFEEALKIRRDAGLAPSNLYYLGIRTENPGSPFHIHQYARQVAAARSIALRFGYESLYVYGIDEAPDDLLQKQRHAWRAIQEVGGKVFIAGWRPGHFEQVGDIVDLFIDGQPPKREEAVKFQSRGKKIFSYNRPQVGVENPYLYRKNYGLRLWREGYDGAMNYAYQHGFGNIWDDFDHPEFRDHCFVYPSSDGVIDTLAWEGFREAIDDVRYIATLEAEIKKRDNSNLPEISAARKYLLGLKNSDVDDLDLMRKKIIGHILAITREG